jgi:hypothetical protein
MRYHQHAQYLLITSQFVILTNAYCNMDAEHNSKLHYSLIEVNYPSSPFEPTEIFIQPQYTNAACLANCRLSLEHLKIAQTKQLIKHCQVHHQQ